MLRYVSRNPAVELGSRIETYQPVRNASASRAKKNSSASPSRAGTEKRRVTSAIITARGWRAALRGYGPFFLDRPYRHGYDIVHPHGFFDYEGFAVSRADQVAVEAGDSAQTLADLRLIGEQAAGLVRRPIL